ncbi:hyaluronan-binding protein 2 [Archocentrus centrarchus]|uniref:hyaluronan-binding protein 2 n=1 Tax=Archocentrus centrarchus TaxID=63155 RepID=UPI0011E9E6D3|nr:hyaluronan-binding protein 2 [Archocentrus centrarchus]
MNLKLLFFCVFLAVLLTPAELKHKKDKHQESSRHGTGKHEKKKHRGRFEDIREDFFFRVSDDEDDDDDHRNSDWLLEIQALDGRCTPNPCLNNGVCKEKGRRHFKCDCPKPFKGKKCERGPAICKRGGCGHGECVLTSTPPYYQCKCKEPFQPPDCRTVSLCQPNPCRNGGTCNRDGNDFDCHCPEGFRGRFCHVGPNDCYVDDGESYRGNVSETDDGDECLYWNSHFILASGVNPFTSFEDSDGLGPHNFCRNPDGEPKPWCFFRRGRILMWDYCDVRKCPKPTSKTPTEVVPTHPQPPQPGPTHPQPPQPEPTKPQPPQPEPTKPQPPQPEPTKPQPPQPQPTKPQPPQPEPTKPQPPQPEPTKPQPPQPGPTKPQPTAKLPTPAIPPPGKPTEAPKPSAPSLTLAPLPTQFATCGIPQPKKALTRIFGGLKVSPGAIPWQVSVQVKPKGSSLPFNHVCGGILIASCWVLTAGHCIEPNKDMQVLAGSLSLSKPDLGAQIIPVQKATKHANYRETSAAVYNDIGLLKLSGNPGFCANETQFVKTACLPNAQLPDGTECKISGWGATEQSNLGSNHLLEANVLLINQEKCSEPVVYGNILGNSMFCAGYLEGGVDSCQGDSGGPLTCVQNNANVVYGVVSWGDQCGKKNKPGVYTQVTHFLDWIRANTEGAISSATPISH